MYRSPQEKIEVVPLTLPKDRPAHTGTVEIVCASGDGRTLLSGGRDDRLILWRADENMAWRAASVSQSHADFILAASLTIEGDRGISAGRDTTIKIWETKNDRLSEHAPYLGHQGSVLTAQLWRQEKKSGGSLLVASGGVGQSLHVWEVPDGNNDKRINWPIWKDEKKNIIPDTGRCRSE